MTPRHAGRPGLSLELESSGLDRTVWRGTQPMADSTPVHIDFAAKPILVASHPRSGTHLMIDGLRHFFAETYRKQRWRQPVHDLYVNLDRLHPHHPFALDERRIREVFRARTQRVIIKSHCAKDLDQVGKEHRDLAQAIVDESDVVYVVRDVRPVMTSFMALRPLKYPDSPTEIASFLRADLDGQGPPARTWALHIAGWIDRPGVHVVKFEEMMADYAGIIGKLGRSLKLTPNGRPIRIYPKPRSRLENRVRRVLGRQFSSSIDNLRMRIKTPRWRDVMTEADLDLLREQAGEMMARLGYAW